MPELLGMKTPYPRAMTFRGKMVNIVLAMKIFERKIPLILSASREEKSSERLRIPVATMQEAEGRTLRPPQLKPPKN